MDFHDPQWGLPDSLKQQKPFAKRLHEEGQQLTPEELGTLPDGFPVLIVKIHEGKRGGYWACKQARVSQAGPR